MYNTIPYNYAEYNIDGLPSTEGVFLQWPNGWINIMDLSKYSVQVLNGDSISYRSNFIERRDFGENIDVYQNPFSLSILWTIIDTTPETLQSSRYEIKNIEREGLIYWNWKGIKKYAKVTISKIEFVENLINVDRFTIELSSPLGRYLGMIKRSVGVDGEIINNSWRAQEIEASFVASASGTLLVGINGVDVTVPGVQSGDIVYINMIKKTVTINNELTEFNGLMWMIHHEMISVSYVLAGSLTIIA